MPSASSIPNAVVAILVTVIESKNNLCHAWKTAPSYSILNDVEKHEVNMNTENPAF